VYEETRACKPRLYSRAVGRVLILLALAAVARAGDPPGGFFKNEAWGYKVRVPKGWRPAALPPGEQRIASKHLGKRELESVKSSYWSREAPEMWVAGFSHKDGVPDYQAYIRNSGFVDWGDGYDFVKEKETAVGGVKVTKYEITIPKEARKKEAPRRVVAWVYHFDDFDFAVQFKVLDEHYDEYAASFRTCMKSFKRVERKNAVPSTVAESSGDSTADLTPEERARARKKEIDRACQREIDSLADGWKNRRSKHFLVLYNADDKFVRATVAHAEAVRVHLGKTFGGVEAESAFLRIFAPEGEKDAYAKGEQSRLLRAILVVFGHGYVKDNEYENLNREIWSQWCDARNPHLEGALPPWLKAGLDKYMDMMRSKGKRITFSNEDWGRDEMRLTIKKGDYQPLHKLVEGSAAEDQCKSVVFWLMTAGRRGKYKKVVTGYVGHLADALDAGGKDANAVAFDQTFAG